MKPIRWLCKVTETGKLDLAQRDKFRVLIDSLRGEWCWLVLEKKRSKRSGNQNRYYWGVVVAMLAEHIGYRLDEYDRMHGEIAYLFLRDNSGPMPRDGYLLDSGIGK